MDDELKEGVADVVGDAAEVGDADDGGARSPRPTRPEGGSAQAGEEPEDLEQIVEALIFTSRTPVTSVRLSMATGVTKDRVEAVVEALRGRYAEGRRGFTIENLGGGWQMLSNPEYVEWVERLYAKDSDGKLSPAALETLAVVAYRQPVMRADIEAIRGVQAGAMLRGLMEKDLVRVAGRAEALGRPLLYGTTKRFLDHFGLASLDDLPNVRELQEP